VRAKLQLLAVFIIYISILCIHGQDSQDFSNDFYTISIDLPSNEIYDVSLSLGLPNGMVYKSGSLVTNQDINYLAETIVGSNPCQIIWTFGEIDNFGNEDLNLDFQVTVADVESNQNGVVLPPIKTTLNYRDSDNKTYTSSGEFEAVKVVEPDLRIDRFFEPASGWRGDTITCDLNIYHSSASRSNAYDVVINEYLAEGLSYIPGSLEILNGPDGGISDSQSLSGHFPKIDPSWDDDNKILLRYKATIDNSIANKYSMSCRANLDWSSTAGDNSEERQYSKTSEDSIMLIPKLPEFNVTLADNPDPVVPGGKINYAASYSNTGSYAPGTTISINYDPNLAFVSASPSPDQGTNNIWDLGDLDKGDSGIIKVTLQASSALTDGSILTSSAEILNIDGSSAQSSASTSVESTSSSLIIEKNASDQIIRPGGTLDYEISYSNAGNSAASNVTITDIVDSNLEFDPANSNPKPTKVWEDDDGTHLWWNASILNSETVPPGGSGVINFQVSLPAYPEHPEYDWIYNKYKIDSDQSQGDYMTLSTAVIHSLYIRKEAKDQVYAYGETVEYTITYGNDLEIDLENAVIMDVLPSAKYMEYVEADPAPNSIEGNILIWNIGYMPSKSSGKIHIYAQTVYNRSSINYFSNSRVSGQGYVNFGQKLDTAENPNYLTNNANITAWLPDQSGDEPPETDSSSATIILSESFGTMVDIKGHGSGTYSREDESHLSSRNKTIQIKTSLSELHNGTDFTLPGDRTISYNSKWSEAQKAKNRVTGSTMVERYMYAQRIDRDSSLLLDKNGSTLESQTSFEGAGHIGLLKESSEIISSLYVVEGPAHNRAAPTFESKEDYLGSFNVTNRFDEYGENAESNRSVSGTGFIADDKRISKSQRSHEAGTGIYQAEDMIQTETNYIA